MQKHICVFELTYIVSEIVTILLINVKKTVV